MGATESLDRTITESLADPEFRQSFYRGQRSIIIDIEEYKTTFKRNPIYDAARRHGLSLSINGNTAYLYIED